MNPSRRSASSRTGEDEPLDYGFGELDGLTHAYAVTSHRSQGGECAAVMIR